MLSQSVETGFSDHYQLIYAVLKSTYSKIPLKKIVYSDYNNWSEERWKMELERSYRAVHPSTYSEIGSY